jgi:hypothetical protein
MKPIRFTRSLRRSAAPLKRDRILMGSIRFTRSLRRSAAPLKRDRIDGTRGSDMRARIYQPPKNAMQSGRAGTEEWLLEFEPAEPRRADPLMGWSGSADTQSQVRLRFPTREDAVAYAERNAIPYDLELPALRKPRPKAYADNFKTSRWENWTH